MCLGVETLAIVTAIGSAASSAIGSIASYSQQQQQSNYQNAVAQQQYNAQLTAYQQSERAYSEQTRLNMEAANRAYVSEQGKLTAEYRKASEKAQELSIKSLQQQGTVLASGRSGQSIGLLMADADRMFGRDYAMLGQNLAYAEQDYTTGTQSIFNQAQTQQNLAASQRMLQPSAPIKTPGPSGIGLIAGLGGAVVGGMSTFGQLKAPSTTTSVPRPVANKSLSTPTKTVIDWK